MVFFADFIRERYGSTFDKFCAVFAANRCEIMSRRVEVSIGAGYNCTTPQQIDYVYGKGAARDWLAYQLAYFYATLRVIKSYQECEEVALALMSMQPVNAPEYMVFLWRVRTGEYGNSYGRYDVETLCTQFRNFLTWRNSVLQTMQKRCREYFETLKKNPPQVSEKGK